MPSPRPQATASPVITSLPGLADLRLRAQRLGVSPLDSPAGAVRWMLAMQAQDYPGVKWSVGLRVAGATERDVEAAFDEGSIVRSWPMRGTLHLVAAEDLRWMLALTTSRSIASAAERRARLELTESDVERARELALAALSGRRSLPRSGLLAAIDSGGVSMAGQRGYHTLWYLAQTGTLVLGPSEGRQQTYALLDDWVPPTRARERDEALGELAARYFASHGPATVYDLARWSGLTVRDVRRGLEVAGERLTSVEAGRTTYHLAPETRELPSPMERVLLLPGFDEYVLGYGERAAILDAERADAIVPGGNGMFKATVIVDGRVAGTWRRTPRGREVVVDVDAFERLPEGTAGSLERAVEAYGRFLGRAARLGRIREG